MKKYLILALLLATNLGVFAQKEKDVRIRIKHEGSVLLDTTVSVDEKQAEDLIVSLVASYSKEEIDIDSKNIKDVYTFNIANGQLREETTFKESTYSDNSDLGDKTKKELEKAGKQIKKNWKNANINVFMDSIGSGFKTIKSDIVGDSNKSKKKDS